MERKAVEPAILAPKAAASPSTAAAEEVATIAEAELLIPAAGLAVLDRSSRA